MIGRFTKQGTYRELFDIHDILRVVFGGLLALLGFLWESASGFASVYSTILILSSVAVNGIPIIWSAVSGILIKGGRYIENAASAGTVLFDKTGTLTKGDPRVDEIFSTDGYDVNYVLQQAACVEQNSTHPLARAVLKAAYYARVGILSGDHEKSVQRLAQAVGATDVWSGLKPGDKLQVINNLRSSEATEKIIFVGDGINDAPALAAADVGIAMGAKGTEVALETADIALMQDDISKIPLLIKLGRRMVATIKWNIFFGLAFNLIAVLAGGSGLLTPIMGAVVHNIGSVLVVLSSASIAFAGD